MGYLSDQFGRRYMLLLSYTAMTIIAVLTGFVATDVQLFVLRALNGVASGAVGTLVNAALSDYTPLNTRGKYQGLQGVTVFIGGPIGMVGGAALASIGQWRVLYYGIEAPFCFMSLVMAYFWCPANLAPPTLGEIWSSIKTIDYLGILSLSAAVVSGLIVLSQAGRQWPIGDPRIIALLVICAISTTAFLWSGFLYRQIRPVIPFSIFRNRTVSTILVQQFLVGTVYWAFLYFIPTYLQFIHALNPLKSALCMLPWLFVHGFWMTASGEVMTLHLPFGNRARQISYGPMMWFGFACLTAACAGISVARTTATVVGLEVLFAMGTGSVFQNSVAALQSHTDQDESAVVCGVRSMVRGIGGSVGSAIGSVVITHVLKSDLPDNWKALGASTFSKPPYDRMSSGDAAQTVLAYEHAFGWVFLVGAIAMALCFLLCAVISDHGLQREEIQQKERRMSAEHL
jgi:MFS family permease